MPRQKPLERAVPQYEMIFSQAFEDNRKTFFSLSSRSVIPSEFLSKGDPFDMLVEATYNAMEITRRARLTEVDNV